MAYLRQCLDSVFSQTFQDFFVVLVDDGSTDFSYELAKAYERKRPDRMKALRLPEKRMAGGARNAGMDWPVECEYLCFMDSDDYLYSKDSLRAMRDAVAEDRPGLALFDWYVERDGVVRRCELGDFGRYVRENRLAQTPWNAAWSRLLRSDLAKPFLECCMRGEDTYQMLQVLDETPVVKQTHEAAYVYRLHGKNTVLSESFKEHGPALRKALSELRSRVKTDAVRKSIDRRLA